MLKTDKERIVEELAAELGAAETLIVADYRGLTNKQLEALRDRLHPARRALPHREEHAHASRGRAGRSRCAARDARGPDRDRVHRVVGRSGGRGEGARATAQGDERPHAPRRDPRGQDALGRGGRHGSRRCRRIDVLRGQLVGAIVAPLTQLLALVSAPLRDLHGLIDARIKQLEEQGEVVEPVAEATVDRRPATDEEPAGASAGRESGTRSSRVPTDRASSRLRASRTQNSSRRPTRRRIPRQRNPKPPMTPRRTTKLIQQKRRSRNGN